MSDDAEFITRLLADWHAGVAREQNFRRLFDRYYRRVFRFFEKRGFSAEDCDDLTQETFFRIYAGLGAFRQEARFETWLFQIATNTYRLALRRQSAQRRAGLNQFWEGIPDEQPAADADRQSADPLSAAEPLDQVLDDELQRVLRQAIEALPEQMRRCMILRIYQDLSYREIAVAMRLSVETVKSHLHQARQRLREELVDYFGQ